MVWKNKSWTEEEKQYVVDVIGKKTYQEIADKLNRSIGALHHVVRQLKKDGRITEIKWETKKAPIWTKEKALLLMQEHQNNSTFAAIQKKIGKSPNVCAQTCYKWFGKQKPASPEVYQFFLDNLDDILESANESTATRTRKKRKELITETKKQAFVYFSEGKKVKEVESLMENHKKQIVYFYRLWTEETKSSVIQEQHMTFEDYADMKGITLADCFEVDYDEIQGRYYVVLGEGELAEKRTYEANRGFAKRMRTVREERV